MQAVNSDYTAWQGHPTAELIESWGEPDNTRSLSADTTALSWNDARRNCEITFIEREGRIIGYSDTDC